MTKLRFEGATDSQIPGVLGTSLPAPVVENPGELPGEQAPVGCRPGLQAFQPMCFGSRIFFFFFSLIDKEPITVYYEVPTSFYHTFVI